MKNLINKISKLDQLIDENLDSIIMWVLGGLTIFGVIVGLGMIVYMGIT